MTKTDRSADWLWGGRYFIGTQKDELDFCNLMKEQFPSIRFFDSVQEPGERYERLVQIPDFLHGDSYWKTAFFHAPFAPKASSLEENPTQDESTAVPQADMSYHNCRVAESKIIFYSDGIPIKFGSRDGDLYFKPLHDKKAKQKISYRMTKLFKKVFYSRKIYFVDIHTRAVVREPYNDSTWHGRDLARLCLERPDYFIEVRRSEDKTQIYGALPALPPP